MTRFECAERSSAAPGRWAEDPALSRLHQALNEIRCREPHPAVEAIPWITLKHPIHPVQEELINGSTPAPPAATRRRFWACLLEAAGLTARLVRLRIRHAAALRRLRRERFDVAAKSWVFSGQPAPGADFYYGDLGVRLARRGLRLLLLTSDPRGWDLPVPAFLRSDAGGQLPEWCLVPLSAPFRALFAQRRIARRLRLWAASLQEGLLRRAVRRASEELLACGLTAKALYPCIGREAVRLWNLRAFMTLYEGHGWERCLLQAARRQSPRCLAVAYQHTILMPYQMELLSHLPPALPPRPDLVLCLGERSLQLLSPAHHASELLAFGSFRNTLSQTRAEGPSTDGKRVLVLPEGFRDEAVRLFNCALEAASLDPRYRFVLRCHPVLPFQEIRGDLAQEPSELPNVELSDQRPIEEEFARAGAVLYRGSSSVLYAVLRGLKPIYLRGGACIDPLFELEGWRETAGSAAEVVRILNDLGQTPRQERWTRWKEAADYVEQYSSPVREEAVEELARAIRSERGSSWASRKR